MVIGNIIQARVKIEGKRPLLWHALTPDSLPLERKEREGVPGNNPNEWKKTVLEDPQTHQLYLPGTYFFGCLRDASKYTKSGRASYQTRMQATLMILDERIFVDDRFLPDPLTQDSSQPVYLDVRAARNPTTKGLNIRYRVACSPGWTTAFRMEFDRTLVSQDLMVSILRDAGSLVGVGNGRNIGMGRFETKSFEILSGD